MLMSKFIDACSRTGLLSATFSTTGKCCRKKHVKKRAMFWMNASSWVEPLRNACGRTRRGSASACGAAARRHGGTAAGLGAGGQGEHGRGRGEGVGVTCAMSMSGMTMGGGDPPTPMQMAVATSRKSASKWLS
jgi:hypothetical protein